VINDNLKNLEYVLNKIVYLKSHAVNMMFKDAIVLKKEAPDEETIKRGMRAFKIMMQNALVSLMGTEGGALLDDIDFSKQQDTMTRLIVNMSSHVGSSTVQQPSKEELQSEKWRTQTSNLLQVEALDCGPKSEEPGLRSFMGSKSSSTSE